MVEAFNFQHSNFNKDEKSFSYYYYYLCWRLNTKHWALSALGKYLHCKRLMAYVMFCSIEIEIWFTKGSKIPILLCIILSAEAVCVCVYLYNILMKRWPICGCSFYSSQNYIQSVSIFVTVIEWNEKPQKAKFRLYHFHCHS